MELVDVKNNLLINKIVKKHFSLGSKSQRLFTERLLYERPIAKEFQKILDSQNSKDLRARFSLEVDAMEGFDSSWQNFKSHFFDYIRARGLQYKNFLNNKVLINKNEIKIVKDLVSYFEEKVDSYFDGIGAGNGRFSVYGYAQNIFDSELAALEILKQEIKSKLKVEASDLERFPFYLDKPYSLKFQGFLKPCVMFERRNRPFEYDSYMNHFSARDLNDISKQMDLFFKEENYNETNIVFYNKGMNMFIHLSISSLFSKQEIKKIKEQIKNTIKEENEKYIRRVFADITQEKFFKGQELELVFSLNYADWFLASTGDSWSSCISLYSNYDECFWTGIPQLIGDKSRAMIYITEKNGKKKEFHGIKVDKFIARSWIQLWRSKSTNETLFSITKSYPIEIKVKDNLENILGLREIGDSYGSDVVSRYYSENLWFENNFLTTIYLDLGSYRIAKRNKAKYSLGDYGYYSLSDGRGSCRFRKHLGSIEKISDFLYKGTIFDDIISNNSSVIKEYYYQDDYEEEYEEYEEEEAW